MDGLQTTQKQVQTFLDQLFGSLLVYFLAEQHYLFNSGSLHLKQLVILITTPSDRIN